jgi:apolipoprotein N-acyltransferase
MVFANSRRLPGAFLAAVGTGLMIYFGTGLHPWWPLMWFAPLPVLLFARRSSGWAAGLTAFAAMLAGGLNLFYYLNSILQLPAGVQATIYGVPAVLFAAAVLLYRALLQRRAWWSATLALPSLLVSFEYLGNLTSPHGTGGNLSYSQLRFLPFLQLASVTGPWGMSFFLLLFPAALAVSVSARRTAPRQAMRIPLSAAGLIAVILVFGAIRLGQGAPAERVRVGLIASDASGNRGISREGADTERLLRDYSSHAEALAAKGARVIVMPEKMGIVGPSDVQQADAILQSLADKFGATVVAGVVELSGGASYNRARIYRPNSAVLTYDKHHMLPPFESYLKPGTSMTILREPSGIWGVAICKDMDFTPLSREYGNAGAGLMLVPAWDFNVDRLHHGHMSIMRGVESGFSVARAAKQGYLTVTDNRGRVLAESRSDSAPFSTLSADVPVAHDSTIYARLGDWFAWITILIFAAVSMQLYRVHRRDRPQKMQTPPKSSAAFANS